MLSINSNTSFDRACSLCPFIRAWWVENAVFTFGDVTLHVACAVMDTNTGMCGLEIWVASVMD